MSHQDDASPLQQQFVEKIASDELIASIVGTRVDIGRAQQRREKPYVVVYEIITEPYHDLAGEIGLSKSLLQIDAWSEGPDGLVEVKRIANRIREFFKNGFRGPLVEEGLHIESCQVIRYDVTGQRPDDGSDNYIRRCSLDLEVIHEDPTETED